MKPAHKTTIVQRIRMLIILLCGSIPLFGQVPAISAGDTVFIPADNPAINYYGRFDTSTPAQPRYNWSGVIIEAAFPGPIIGMRLAHDSAFYDVEIDGTLDTVIATVPGSAPYFFRSDLSPALHTLRIKLRSENHDTAGTFFGLYLANGKTLADAPAKPSRRIEFIGDSYTAGYGIESTGRTCTPELLRKFTNTNRSFAAIITASFHAQSQILSWSGAGMTRNYGDPSKRSARAFPVHYEQTIDDTDNIAQNVPWNAAAYKPQAVVICLGTNDYSTSPNPDDSMYVGDYHKLIARVLGNSPDAMLLCVSTGNATMVKNVKRVVTEQTTTLNHPNVYYAAFPSGLASTGCDYHPSLDDNKKIAKVLTDTLMKKLGWDTASTTVSGRLPPTESRVGVSVLSGVCSGDRLVIRAAASIPPGTAVSLMTVRGELLDRGILGPDRTCTFSKTKLHRGLYLVGSNDHGWIRTAVR
jgi:lysophospholipase L1-like esterase